MSLAESDALLFARKGEAAPSPFAGRDAAAAAFEKRRRLTLVALAPPAERPRRRHESRKRFTFRLSGTLHAGLAAAAARAGVSRQRYLERLLVEALEDAYGGGAS